jgi:hypothetical protein
MRYYTILLAKTQFVKTRFERNRENVGNKSVTLVLAAFSPTWKKNALALLQLSKRDQRSDKRKFPARCWTGVRSPLWVDTLRTLKCRVCPLKNYVASAPANRAPQCASGWKKRGLSSGNGLRIHACERIRIVRSLPLWDGTGGDPPVLSPG